MPSTKRDAICDAALSLFAQQGIDGTATREITERAGTAEGTLYRHFEGKQALAEYLFERGAQQFHDHLRRSIGEETAPRDVLAALVRGIFSFGQAQPDAFRYLLSMHHTGILKDRDGTLPPPMHPFIETLERGMETGAFRTLPPALATGWIIAMAQRAIVFLGSDVIDDSPETVVEHTVRAALRIVDARCTLHASPDPPLSNA